MHNQRYDDGVIYSINTSEGLVGEHNYWMGLEIGTEFLSGASQG